MATGWKCVLFYLSLFKIYIFLVASRNSYPWYSFPSPWLFANFILGSKKPVNEALMLYFTNRQQFSMDCTLIDDRNVVNMFKTQAEPRAAGEWCHCKVWNILTSFLRSTTAQTLENCCRFIVYNNIDNFEVHFRCARGRKKVRNKKQIVPPSRHFCGLYSYWT